MKMGNKLLSMLLAGCLAASSVPALAVTSQEADDYTLSNGYALVERTSYDEAGQKTVAAYSYDSHAKVNVVNWGDGTTDTLNRIYDKYGRQLEFKNIYTDEGGNAAVDDWEKTNYVPNSVDYSYQILNDDGSVYSTLYYTSGENSETYTTYAGTDKNTILEKVVETYREDGIETVRDVDGKWHETSLATFTTENGLIRETIAVTYASGDKATLIYQWYEDSGNFAGVIKLDAKDNVVYSSSCKYDSYGNQIEFTDNRGTKTVYTYEYDKDGMVTSCTESDAGGNITWQGYYDANGNLSKEFYLFEGGKAVENKQAYYYKYVTTDEILAAHAAGNFGDVNAEDFFAAPVVWAVNSGITNGTTEVTFSPEKSCTRAEIVTMLWRAAQEPTPAATSNPFTDVPDSAYYKNAVLWAVENGITNGISDTSFAPDSACTRAQAATFLWRSAGEAAPLSSVNPFTDITDTQNTHWYYNAVLWAVENGITNGMTSTTFEPETICLRKHIVTFLYRAMV